MVGDTRILIVEDEATTLSLIRRTLANEGFSILEAGTGEAGLGLYWEYQPQLIVLDIILPGMDGFEVCQTLRSRGEGVPILMLTSKGKDSDRVLGLNLGADDYVVKPFYPKELVARVKAILRRTSKSVAPTANLEYRGITLEFRYRKCIKENGEVDLTPTEFSLLAELLSHPGQVLSRDVLNERLWGANHRGSAKSLDVYIGRLRDKLEGAQEEPPLIHTERGVGYFCL